jgi:hypothetical protein
MSQRRDVFGSQQRGSQGAQVIIIANEQITIQQDRQNLFMTSFNFSHFIIKHFLPINYPSSVRSEYLEYQIYDSIQALCSYLRGVLSTQALFVTAGVGILEANAMSATITWILKDGIGMFFSIIFASTFSIYFGSYIKEWRLFADLINDFALSLDLLTPFFPSSYHLLLLSFSAIGKTMCGISANSTKLCITNHLCLHDNEADVNTKENSQETAICLIGLILGIGMSHVLVTTTTTTTTHTSSSAYLVFLFLTSLHVYCNYYAIKCLQLRSINHTRGWLLFQASYELLYLQETSLLSLLFQSLEKNEDSPEQETLFLEHYQRSSCSSSDPPLSISRINSQDSVFLTLQLCSQHFSPIVMIYMGVSLQDALTHLPISSELDFPSSSTPPHLSKGIHDRWMELQEISSELKLKYCIVPRLKSGYSVILQKDSTQLDQYEAFCRCLFLEKQKKDQETFEKSFWRTSKDFKRFWKGHLILLNSEVCSSSIWPSSDTLLL